ncbi:hypothetical protein LTR39_006418, partial [Cryomyces antarcticus]
LRILPNGSLRHGNDDVDNDMLGLQRYRRLHLLDADGEHHTIGRLRLLRRHLHSRLGLRLLLLPRSQGHASRGHPRDLQPRIWCQVRSPATEASQAQGQDSAQRQLWREGISI